MSSYEFLAGCYDRFTYDVDYAAWADYIEQHFRKRGLPGKTVLDLACGTGSLTRELALRGYEMIGVDLSAEMLAEAAEKNRNVGEISPMFLCQPMEKLDLYGTIDACVCCLDSVNYVTSPKKLQKAFERVHLFLMPGGLFLFDVNTPEKLEGLVSRAKLEPGTVLYMDYGSREMGNHEGTRKGYTDMCDRLMSRGIHLTSRIVPGGTHSEASWEKQLPFVIHTLMYELE